MNNHEEFKLEITEFEFLFNFRLSRKRISIIGRIKKLVSNVAQPILADKVIEIYLLLFLLREIIHFTCQPIKSDLYV